MAVMGLVVHPERPLGRRLGLEIAAWLQAEGHEVRIPASDREVLPALAAFAVADDRLGEDVQFVVSIGGDGTMLRAVRLVSRAGTPVLGVNVGHLGYLTEVRPDNWRPALVRVLAGDYLVQERMTLDVGLVGADGPSTVARTSLNDAVVEKLEAGHTIRVAVAISGQPAISYAADALIVCTPTGSTAYNLSAGGPVVSPRLEALTVTPVAAHSLFGRALVVARDEIVRVEVLGGSAVLGVDGQHCGHLAEGDVVECRASTQPARLITFGEQDFWRVITAKFGLAQ
ncbi:MAG TPA: NAD(+)/NADH kinase [Acidimicrobiales bacterium]|jgi:NAD+ kinase